MARLFVILMLFLFLFFPKKAWATFTDGPNFPIGWYHFILNVNELENWTGSGANFFVFWPATFNYTQNKSILDRADALGAQGFMSIHSNTWDSSKTAYVISLSSQSNLIGWYLRDEPQSSGPPPSGAYSALRSAPFDHPAGIVHFLRAYSPVSAAIADVNTLFNDSRWKDQTDILMLDHYPGDGRSSESYFDYYISISYDGWKAGSDWAKINNKDFVAVAQGWTDNYFMSEEEYRFHALSAIVAGADGLLFWHCNLGDDCPQYNTDVTFKSRIEKLITYVTKEEGGIISKAMKASEQYDANDAYYHGVNDPRIAINVSNSQLIYRYGYTEGKHIIFAANIANHAGNNTGTAISNVRFTLPIAANGTITVIGENRILTMTNGTFTDNFDPYEIHAYSTGGTSTSPTPTLPTVTATRTPTPPPNTPTPTSPSLFPGDANGDGRVDGLDYIIWLNHYNQATTRGNQDGDFNNSGLVDRADYIIWQNNYGT